jgi:glycerol-3-phosphate dehydrogenase (NAD(P)+)
VNELGISRIGVIGAGSWGTTLANLLAGKGFEVDLWVREQEVLDQIKNEHINSVFLPEVKLFDRLNPVKCFEEAVVEKELILMVVPSHVFREVLTGVRRYLNTEMGLMAATKGIENDSLMMMSQVVKSVLSGEYMERFACIGGPSFAQEVCKKHPTAVTIACGDLEHAERLQQVFNTDFFRVYISKDVTGVQLGGALKNVIAIGAGVSDGLGFGHNARAALITRGLAEITRLAVVIGANPHTLAGLSGMGDLVLTCTGDMSRNRTVGLKIGKGMTLQEITRSTSTVAEGIKTARSVYDLGKKMEVDMPICNQVYHILYNEKDPKEAVKYLMTRELKVELEY